MSDDKDNNADLGPPQFPPPPVVRNRDVRPEELPPKAAPPQAHIPMFNKKDVKLTDNETAFILRSHLRPNQAEDPNIIKFIMEYLVCRSTAQAARAAGLTPQQGQGLRMKPEIHACIQALTEKAVMKYGYDATETIERVKEIAGLDPIEFENADGSFKTHMSQIAPEARRAIKKFKCKNTYGFDPNGMKVVIGQLIEVEVWDKLKASELLGREKNIFKETKKVEHDVTTNMRDALLGSRDRGERRVIEIEGRVVDEQGDEE